jgi:choline dehydrogenase-like flavoprotein
VISRLQDLAGTPAPADLCIVGSGAAGLAIAREFLGTRWRVLVLESGDWQKSAQADDLNTALCGGLAHTGAVEGRARVFGGGTTAWGGQLLPLRQSETARRDWVAHSGWPLAPGDLAPYYRRAERLLGIEESLYDGTVWEQLRTGAPDFDPESVLFRFSQWAPLMRRNLAVNLRAELSKSANVSVLLGGTVARLVMDSNGASVRHLDVRDVDGRQASVSARHFILCTGGIETPRILLASNAANESGNVGRYFQDHISYTAAQIEPSARARIRHFFEPRYRGQSMLTCKIEPTDHVQREHKLLNVMAHVKFDIPSALGLFEVKQMLKAIQQGKAPVPSAHALLAMARGSWELSRLAFGRIALARRSAPTRGAMYLLVDVEQAPNPQSRIRLARECDRFGVPRALVDWRLGGQEYETIERFTALLAPQWRRAGLGELRLGGPPDFTLASGLSSARDIYHHMGATRMSEDPAHGVVRPDLRCHTVHNLHIAGSSVFPTGGIANPTFTILALAIRLGDRLKERLMQPHAGALAASPLPA